MNKYIELAKQEIINRTFAITRQYLDVNNIQKDENGDFAIERISEDNEICIVYFKIQDERYYFGVSFNKSDDSLNGTFIENANLCYLTATSDVLSKQEIANFTNLKYTSGWSKGDLRRNGKSFYTFSRVNFEYLTSECYSTEDSITKMLDILEKDRQGVINLTHNSDAYLSICKYQYISANSGFGLNAETIKRLNDLNLGFDIDVYIVGSSIKD